MNTVTLARVQRYSALQQALLTQTTAPLTHRHLIGAGEYGDWKLMHVGGIHSGMSDWQETRELESET